MKQQQELLLKLCENLLGHSYKLLDVKVASMEKKDNNIFVAQYYFLKVMVKRGGSIIGVV
jgi:hypothetical protein